MLLKKCIFLFRSQSCSEIDLPYNSIPYTQICRLFNEKAHKMLADFTQHSHSEALYKRRLDFASVFILFFPRFFEQSYPYVRRWIIERRLAEFARQIATPSFNARVYLSNNRPLREGKIPMQERRDGCLIRWLIV